MGLEITDGRTDRRTDGRMDGWTDGRTDGQTDKMGQIGRIGQIGEMVTELRMKHSCTSPAFRICVMQTWA